MLLLLITEPIRSRLVLLEMMRPKLFFQRSFPPANTRAVLVFLPSPKKKTYIGDQAEVLCGLLNNDFPMHRGLVTDWEGMEEVWQHTFSNELRVAPDEHPVLLTEPAFNPKDNRRKMAEIMFESFNVPAVYISPQPELALYSNGCDTGIVVESGDGVTYCVPMIGGCSVVPEAITRFDIAGSDVTNYLQELLNKKGYSFSRDSFSDYLSVRDMKKRCGYVALDFDAEMKKPESELVKEYELPDGKKVSIGSERFRCTEILFHPELVGFATGGLHDAIYKSIQKCDISVRDLLCSNIILSGGNTLFDGIADRLKKELFDIVPLEFNVVAPIERGYSVWIGGSVFGCLTSFFEKCLPKYEFDEKGAEAVQLRCPPLAADHFRVMKAG